MKNFGLQLHTLRKTITHENFAEILSQLRLFGYTGVELTDDHYGYTTDEMAKIISDSGLRVLGVHSSKMDMEYALKMGSEFIIYPYSEIKTDDDAVKLGQELCELSEKAVMSGLRLCFHNHNAEFQKGESGDYLFNLVMQNAGDLCEWEPDIGWLKFAGCDPFEFLRNYSGRFPLMHIRQLNEKNEFCLLKNGVIPIDDAIKIGNLLGCEHYIVEQPSETATLDDVEKCARYLKSL